MMTGPWEMVHHNGAVETTDRLRVQGGWLYRTRMWTSSEGTCLALTFAPDQHPRATEITHHE